MRGLPTSSDWRPLRPLISQPTHGSTRLLSCRIPGPEPSGNAVGGLVGALMTAVLCKYTQRCIQRRTWDTNPS